MMIKTIGDWGFFAATVASNLFIVFYLVLAKFWKTAFGRHLFTFMLVIALVLDHAVIQIFFPTYPGRTYVRAVLLWAVAAVIIWRIVILVRVQLFDANPDKRFTYEQHEGYRTPKEVADEIRGRE